MWKENSGCSGGTVGSVYPGLCISVTETFTLSALKDWFREYSSNFQCSRLALEIVICHLVCLLPYWPDLLLQGLVFHPLLSHWLWRHGCLNPDSDKQVHFSFSNLNHVRAHKLFPARSTVSSNLEDLFPLEWVSPHAFSAGCVLFFCSGSRTTLGH